MVEHVDRMAARPSGEITKSQGHASPQPGVGEPTCELLSYAMIFIAQASSSISKNMEGSFGISGLHVQAASHLKLSSES